MNISKYVFHYKLEATQNTALGWSRPKDKQNKTDSLLSLTNALYVIVSVTLKKFVAHQRQQIKWIP